MMPTATPLHQRCRKLGLLVDGPPPVDWAVSHASVPIAQPTGNGDVKLFFSSRDGEGRSHVGWAALDVKRGVVGGYGEDPLLSPGELGAFDDNGTMASSVVEHRGQEYLYYIGWSLGVTVPFYTFIGCAVRDRGDGAFERVSSAPILGRDSTDPYFTTAPWVLLDGNQWRMWYAAGTGWDERREGPLHRYHIRYAESDDGVVWDREGVVCIDYDDETEYAITRPCVVREGDTYKMWYSRRGSSYRIGYAESNDGITWTRKDDEVGIDVSADGWDSEMIEYPCVFNADGRSYLLYNGNGFGVTGIGWALLEP